MLAWSTQSPHVVAAAYNDNYVRTWDVNAKRCLLKVKPSASLPILCLAWSPDGKQLGVGSEDDSFIVLDAVNGAELGKHSCKPSQLDEFQWSANPDFVFTATQNKRGEGLLSVAKLTSEPHFRLQPLQAAGAYSGSALALAVDGARKRVALSADDTVVTIWNARDLTCTAAIDRFDQAPSSLSFSFDGRALASAFSFRAAASAGPSGFGGAAGSGAGAAGSVGFIDIADTRTGRRVGLLKTAEREVFMVCWHPTKPLLAFCGSSTNVSVVTFRE